MPAARNGDDELIEIASGKPAAVEFADTVLSNLPAKRDEGCRGSSKSEA
jgi:hypothetical protein